MPRLKIEGLEDMIEIAEKLTGGFSAVGTAAVYAGAGKAAEVIESAIRSLPEQQGYMKEGQQRNVVTRDEKACMINGLGISHIENVGGIVSAAVGFNGYTNHRTKKYPNGVPIPLVARSVESGSSVRVKHPFMRNAVKSNEQSIKAAMEKAAQQTLEELTK